jgi:hypothetical protein
VPWSSSEPTLYETQYEVLRSQMIGSTTGHRGIGLAVLLQAGMAGWLHAVGTCATALPSGAVSASRSISPPDQASMVARTSATPMMPPTQYTEVAKLIASLVLSGYPVHGPLRASPQQGDSR